MGLIYPRVILKCNTGSYCLIKFSSASRYDVVVSVARRVGILLYDKSANSPPLSNEFPLPSHSFAAIMDTKSLPPEVQPSFPTTSRIFNLFKTMIPKIDYKLWPYSDKTSPRQEIITELRIGIRNGDDTRCRTSVQICATIKYLLVQ